MIKIFVYSCLLSALSVVEVKLLNVNGHVGKNVTFKYSEWNVWTDLKYLDKYFCHHPCSEEKHIIIRAASGKIQKKNRIEITNSAEGLYVTFINLKKSDSKKYYCGVERVGLDAYIEVNLKVTDAESASPRTTLKVLAVTNSSGFISDTSTSYIIYSTPAFDSTTTTAASTTQGAGNVLYVIICVISIVTVLMGVLTLVLKMRRKQNKEDARESPTGPDEVYQSLHPLTRNEDQVYGTLTNRSPTGPDEVYQSLHPLTRNEDQVYSTVTNKNVVESKSVDTSSGS